MFDLEEMAKTVTEFSLLRKENEAPLRARNNELWHHSPRSACQIFQGMPNQSEGLMPQTPKPRLWHV